MSERLTVEARVSPQDIDQVRVGQTAALRSSAFRTTPEINGAVCQLSADVTTEQRIGVAYYAAHRHQAR